MAGSRPQTPDGDSHTLATVKAPSAVPDDDESGAKSCNKTPNPSDAEPSAVQRPSYEDLVAKVDRMEQLLARVNRFVESDLGMPSIHTDPRKPDIESDSDSSYDGSDTEREMGEEYAIQEMIRITGNTRRRNRHKKRVQTRRAREIVGLAPAGEASAEQPAQREPSPSRIVAERMLAEDTLATHLRIRWNGLRTVDELLELNKDIHPAVIILGEPESDLHQEVIGPTNEKPTRDIPADVKDSPDSLYPERIIITSTALGISLRRYIERPGPMGPGGQMGPIPPPGLMWMTFLRPFRSLVYYESSIRDYAKRLELSFAGQVKEPSQVASVSVGNSPASGSIVDDETSEVDEERRLINPLEILHLRCLLKLLDDEKICSRVKQLRASECHKITFTDIGGLFHPGDEVVDQEKRQAYRVLRVTMPKHRAVSPFEWFYNRKFGHDQEVNSAFIQCVYIDFDGEIIGPVVKTFQIPQFNQSKDVRSLPIYPMRIIQDPGYRRGLIERGKMLWNVIQVRPMYYKGHTIDTGEEIDSQVMIDFNEALAYARSCGKDWKPHVDYVNSTAQDASLMAPPPPAMPPGVDIINGGPAPVPPRRMPGQPMVMGPAPGDPRVRRPPGMMPPMPMPRSQRRCGGLCCRHQNVIDDEGIDDMQAQNLVRDLLAKKEVDRRPLILCPLSLRDMLDAGQTPVEDELVLMSYRVFGFILRSRKWAQLDLTYLHSENQTNRDGALNAFDRLVLPPGHKDMVQSLVTQHFRDKMARDRQARKGSHSDPKADLIRGKGQGLIILLHGSPGVGKTTTAEGVAETFRKPLFQVTCGDLGTTAAEVQTELEKNFTLASRWDCILLLDEAEVFLASRARKDFKRNGLVAVFLRVLEYYTGILFLTTNRVGDFDEAFASRIHMSLHYPKLDLEKTLDVFKVNFDLIKAKFDLQGRQLFLDETSILNFARDHYTNNAGKKNQGRRWNGRQIRNACQTVLAMAEFEALKGKLDASLEPSQHVHLKLSHFETIEKAYDEFAIYLGDVYGVDMDELAAEGKFRKNERDESRVRRK